MIKQINDFLEMNNSDYSHENIIELQKTLQYHSDLYYNKDTAEISDKEYDDLLKKLQTLEELFSEELILAWIEKQWDKVWEELVESSFKKVKHSRPMISLGNTYNEEDLRDFDERVYKNISEGNDEAIGGFLSPDRINYVLEFKFDWLWVELIYKNWELTQAITRWNWVEWEDVTQNIFQIENIPKTIAYKEHLEVRGEVVMPISSFDMLNKEALEKGEKVFSNPRNAASGSLRMKDNRVTKKRKLQFFVYDIANFAEYVDALSKSLLTYSPQREEKVLFTQSNQWEDRWQFVSYYDTIKSLEKLGFDISSYFERSENIWQIVEKIQNFWDVKSKIDFEIDGLVLKVDNIELWQGIGYTEHHPKYAIAYKFPSEIFTTIIESVEHQVGRTGTITPVANLEAVNMWWAMIRRATLHNYDECEKLWINVWDSVFIKRAWEVIPKITGLAKKGVTHSGQTSPVDNQVGMNLCVHPEADYILPPKNCPSCNTEVIKDDEKVRYYCPNSTWCFEQKKHKIIYAVGKQGLNIDGLGKAQVEQFLRLWFITDLYSVFILSEKQEEILALEWFQEKSVTNLLKAIEDRKKLDISTLLISLAIPWVWKKTAKELSKLFTWEISLLNFHYTLEQLENLEDIWPEIAKNMQEFFTSEDNKELLTKLVSILDISYFEEIVIKNTDNIFFEKKVCITGSFENYKRPELADMLEKVWWKFVSSVSKNTDFLVAWEKAWSKLTKANDLGVKVLSVEEFIEQM